MAIAKVILNGDTLMDVTSNTNTSSNMLNGVVGTKNDGTSITGNIATKTSSNMTVSGATVTAPAGYYANDASKSVSSGSATTPTTTITKNPTISLTSSTGVITASYNGSSSITPTVNAGWVANGTAGTISTSGTSTYTLTTQAAQTITPTESVQYISSYRWLTGSQTIAAIPSAYVIPSGTSNITSNGTYDVANYASVSVSIAGGEYYAVYKSLAMNSNVLTYDISSFSEWCNSLTSISYQQFAGRAFNGSIHFDNVVNTSDYAFGSAFAGYGVIRFDNQADLYFSKLSKTSVGMFAYNRNISNVYMPLCSIIGSSCFYSCDYLKSVSFPTCVSILMSAFYRCVSLTTVSFPSCITIGGYAFYYCSRLTTINFPVCTSIGTSAFCSCSSLTTANFPSCISIGGSAFYWCSALTTISFPVCTSIGYNAFGSCTSLTTASFPSCTSIGGYAFYYCSRLTSVSFPACITIGSSVFTNCSALTIASFLKCTSIGGGAFSNCTSLTTASFPSCTSIGDYAFAYCSALTTISFPVCTYIGSNAFGSCAFTTINFPACTSIGNSVFYSCTSLTTASFPVCTSIGNYAFRYCFNLVSLYLTSVSSVPQLAANAFYSTPINGYSGVAGRYGSVYVPASLYASFLTATYWSSISARIVSV